MALAHDYSLFDKPFNSEALEKSILEPAWEGISYLSIPRRCCKVKRVYDNRLPESGQYDLNHFCDLFEFVANYPGINCEAIDEAQLGVQKEIIEKENRIFDELLTKLPFYRVSTSFKDALRVAFAKVNSEYREHKNDAKDYTSDILLNTNTWNKLRFDFYHYPFFDICTREELRKIGIVGSIDRVSVRLFDSLEDNIVIFLSPESTRDMTVLNFSVKVESTVSNSLIRVGIEESVIFKLNTEKLPGVKAQILEF